MYIKPGVVVTLLSPAWDTFDGGYLVIRGKLHNNGTITAFNIAASPLRDGGGIIFSVENSTFTNNGTITFRNCDAHTLVIQPPQKLHASAAHPSPNAPPPPLPPDVGTLTNNGTMTYYMSDAEKGPPVKVIFGTLTNNGTMMVMGNIVPPSDGFTDMIFQIQDKFINNGTIIDKRIYPSCDLIMLAPGANSAVLTNRGTIIADGKQRTFYGVIALQDPTCMITNDLGGLITITYTSPPIAQTGSLIKPAILLGILINKGTITIDEPINDATNPAIAGGGNLLTLGENDGSITNNGTITFTGTIEKGGIGIRCDLTNTGTIKFTKKIFGLGVSSDGATVTNSGTICGQPIENLCSSGISGCTTCHP